MLIPFLFILWLLTNWLLAFEYYKKMLDDKEERNLTNFFMFLWTCIWFISIIIVNKSLYDLFIEFSWI